MRKSHNERIRRQMILKKEGASMGLFWKKEKRPEMFEHIAMPEIIDTSIGVDSSCGSLDAAISSNQRDSDSRRCYRQLERQISDGDQGVVLKLYIENFKRMNQLFGFDYCEELLDQILNYLEQETGCIVYRYVGVEYIVILKGYTQGRAIRLAEQLTARFGHGWDVGGTSCLCFASVGLCSYPGYASTADEMLKCLDLAVTKAGELDGNAFVMYDGKLHAQFQRRQAIARYISTALEHEEIEVRYRPTYDTVQKKFVRAEFYMRMFVKDLGMVGSAEFLPIAEDTGQIRNVEYYAMEKAAETVVQMLHTGIEFESVSIPISPVLLLQEDFVYQLRELLERYEIPEGKLAIEIDEYAMSIASVGISALMQELNELGVELILNNFGSGYSGISTLLELPVDTLKFDRMFTWQLETNPDAEPIIEGLLQIADRMGKKLIAEGVETQRQLDALARFGCVYQQGFYYAPTLPQDVLLKVMNHSLEETDLILRQEKEKLKR